MSGGLGGPLGAQSSSSPYIYPPPLFGRLDDPFFGFVPPLVSFPPWWLRRVQTGAMVPPRRASGATAAGGAPNEGWRPLEVDPVKGQVDISVDLAGQVFLRGAVVSEEVAREIVAAARSVRGVTGVFSELQVIPRRAGPETEPRIHHRLLCPCQARQGRTAPLARPRPQCRHRLSCPCVRGRRQWRPRRSRLIRRLSHAASSTRSSGGL